MNRRRFMLLAPISAVCGCVSWKDAIIGTVSVRLLYTEFNQARDAILTLPLNSDERAIMTQVIGSLDAQRIRLGNMDKAGDITLTLLQSRLLLGELASVYELGKRTYSDYLRRTGTVADPFLVQYDITAARAYNAIEEALEAGGVVGTPDLISYLGLALRVFASTRGIPIV